MRVHDTADTPIDGGNELKPPADLTTQRRLTRRPTPRAWSSRLWQPAALLVLIVFGTSVFGGTRAYPLLVIAGIYGIAVVGVSLLAGLGGQITLGHAVFMAMGAYSSAISTLRWGLSPVTGLAVGVLASLALALVTSPLLRLRGWYLAMATIAVSFVLQEVLVNLGSLTGGNNGLFGIPNFSVAGAEVMGEKQYFVLAWTVVLVLFVLGSNIARSRFGRALTAINRDADAAATLGINPTRAKTVLWLIAAVPAALAGSLFAHYSAFIAPADFSFSTSLLLFTAVVIGGERSIFGGLVVITLLMALSVVTTATITVDLVEAIVMIAVYTLSPRGLAGVGPIALAWARRRGLRRA